MSSLFGPSKAEVWRKLSAEIGANFVSGGFWKGDKVLATHGEWTVTLDTFAVSTGKSTTTYTRMRAPFVNPGGFRFSITSRNLFHDLGKLFGMQDVEVGHAAFDRDFIIQGTSDAKLRAFFDNPRVRELIAGQPYMALRVKDDEGWFGAQFPQGVDELHFVVGGVVKDAERLKRLFELFAESLDQLCHIGSAVPAPAGVKL
jgi:hypothetical protein